MKQLADILRIANIIKKGNSTYYNLMSLLSMLNKISGDNIDVEYSVDGISLLSEGIYGEPFYICDKGTFNFYYDALNIKFVDTPFGIDNYILAVTKTNINDLDDERKDRYTASYIEVLRPNTFVPVRLLIRYIKYVANSGYNINWVMSQANEFKVENLYFEFY